MKNLWMFIAATILIVGSIDVNAKGVDKNILGTWTFEIKEAPYEYQRGKTTFYQADTLTKVKIVFDYETLQGSKLKIEGDKVSFDVEVQGEVVKVALKLENEVLSGKAATSQGELPVVMKRITE